MCINLVHPKMKTFIIYLYIFQWRNRNLSDFIKKYLQLCLEDKQVLWVWNNMRVSK